MSSLLTTELKIQHNKKFLKFDGTNSMTANLNLNNNKIVNLQTDEKDRKSAVNVDLMQNKINLLSNLVNQSIHESHITSSAQKKDAFRYLMEDTDESSSENNINVLGINDFPESPHQVNQVKLTFSNSCLKKTHRTSTGHASVLTFTHFRSVTTLWLLNGFHQK